MTATAYNKSIAGPITECPACGSALWDNRSSKTKPTQPDYRCKADNDHAFWLPKANGAAPARQSAPPPPVAAPAPATTPAPAEAFTKLNALFALHDLCLVHALNQGANFTGGDTAEAISARAATLFIAAKDRGMLG